MSEPIPQEVRDAARDALSELGQKFTQAGAAMFRKAGYLQNADPKVHRRVMHELRKFRGYFMPKEDAVLKIEAALLNQTEAECRATAERLWQKRQEENEAFQARIRHSRDVLDWQRGGMQWRETIRRAVEHGRAIAMALEAIEAHHFESEKLIRDLDAAIHHDPQGVDPIAGIYIALDPRNNPQRQPFKPMLVHSSD